MGLIRDLTPMVVVEALAVFVVVIVVMDRVPKTWVFNGLFKFPPHFLPYLGPNHLPNSLMDDLCQDKNGGFAFRTCRVKTLVD